jgi:hypothetical protein
VKLVVALLALGLAVSLAFNLERGRARAPREVVTVERTSAAGLSAADRAFLATLVREELAQRPRAAPPVASPTPIATPAAAPAPDARAERSDTQAEAAEHGRELIAHATARGRWTREDATRLHELRERLLPEDFFEVVRQLDVEMNAGRLAVSALPLWSAGSG